MRALRAALAFLACAAAGASAAQEAHDPPGAYRMLFAGDILLAREVAREIQARGQMSSPWRDMGGIFNHADFVFGNLEGAVGDAGDCREPRELCFAVSPVLLPLLKQAGFAAVGTANNHSGDLGPAGRRATREALQAVGVAAVGSEQSPVFFRLGAHTIGLVNLSLVSGRDGEVDAIPSWQAAQKLRLARALADWVIVSVHWGQELADWVVPEQEAQAQWLIAHGADLIVGSHPHVVQPPACLDGKPVFYSLGNHVFDQKYAITKHGLIADCRIDGDRLTCSGLATETPTNSSFPRMSAAPGPGNDDLLRCPVMAGHPLVISGQTLRPWIPADQLIYGNLVLEGISPIARWRSSAREPLTMESGRLDPERPPLLFTVERHPSPIDDEDGPRPYVYEATSHGLVARWRGSALAWPLLDATLIADTAGRAYVCALHRGDSFVMLANADASSTRTQVYAWNGFGFSGVTDHDLAMQCAHEFGVSPQ
jgi:poly-gamma-glutamate synthesis protein (capsule biosynthesis protein)